ncbi:hypothetical protein FQA39_LY01552 [Lamprigera yunnana]|nr:hypothetical protein FQA39_LY01552 [Lamprigera yunnana]
MCLKWIFTIIPIFELITGQYVQHPFGAVSFTKQTYHQPQGFNYVAPSGQYVNVYFGSRQLSSQSAPEENLPSLSSNIFSFNTRVPEVSASFEDPLGWQEQSSSVRVPKQLFSPANSEDDVATDKQIEAYNDYIKEMIRENEQENFNNFVKF